MTSDAPIAASSAVAESDTTARLAAMTSAERAEWRKNGPSIPESTPTAESSPAIPVDPGVSTETAPTPGSDPGSPAKKKNAETRIQELLAERAQLRAELDSAKRPAPVVDVPAASSPAPVSGEKFPDYESWSTAQGTGPAEYEDYIAERTIHRLGRQQQAERDQVARQATEREAADLHTQYRQAAEAFVAEHPDYWTVVNPITADAPRTASASAIGEVILRSPQATPLLYHLGTHRAEFDRIVALPERRAVYELAKIEASLSPSPAPAPVPGLVTKTVSSAPTPPPAVMSRAQAPVDEVDAARASGDFRRYFQAANARDIAAGRR